MNKKTALKLKKIINLTDNPEHKRLYNTLKKQYSSLSSKDRTQLIKDLKNQFNNE